MYLGKIVEVADSLELCAQPLHPYTKALFAASLPSHPDEERPDIVLTGEVPSALNPPSGCHFHPRCPSAFEVCGWETRDLRDLLEARWTGMTEEEYEGERNRIADLLPGAQIKKHLLWRYSIVWHKPA